MNLPEDLLAEAKATAARTGRTLTAVIEDALRASFARQQQAGDDRPPELPTFAGDGLQDGVDLDDGAALLDLMERGGS